MSTSTVEEPEGAAEPGGELVWRWGVRALYTTLIAAELWILFDWWRDTPGGQLAVARWAERLERVKTAAQECEGCARRKARLQAAFNRMHWEATQIVEGADSSEGEAQ